MQVPERLEPQLLPPVDTATVIPSRTSLLALTLTVLADASAQNEPLADVPTNSELQGARAQVRQSLPGRFENADSDKSRRELSGDLLDLATERQPSASHFALIDEARSMSLAAGDLFVACDCADLLAASYRVDGLRLQADMIGELEVSFRGRLARVDIAVQRLVVLKLACEAGRIELALEQARAATLATREGAAMPPNFGDVHRAVLASTFRRVTAYRGVEQDRQVLTQDPNDAVANGRYGAHLCLAEERWSAGLEYLAKGGDSPSANAARLDLRGPEDAAGCEIAADAWWDVASSDPNHRRAARRRAANWYAQVPGGAERRPAVVAERIAQVRSELHDEVEALGLTVNGAAATRLQEAVVDIFARKYPALLSAADAAHTLAACRPSLVGRPEEDWGEIAVGSATLSGEKKRAVASEMRALLAKEVPGALAAGDVTIVKVMGVWLADIPPQARDRARIAIAKNDGPVVLSVDSDFNRSVTGETPPVGAAFWMAGNTRVSTLREFVAHVVATADGAAARRSQTVRVVYSYPDKPMTMTDHFRFTKAQIDDIREAPAQLGR
ncbi:MAG: hypothetical protein KDC98_06220 [Planctomycetes bacterium]|nr:hypothetical protein [Planctomycetota bacterium]